MGIYIPFARTTLRICDASCGTAILRICDAYKIQPTVLVGLIFGVKQVDICGETWHTGGVESQ